MEEKKISIIALYKILEEYTDENNILTQPELLRLIEAIYHIKLDRRTLYKNIEMLIDLGYDISTYSDNNKGYYLRERQFELSEIYLLCNAIHSSNYIPSSSSKELIDKLLKTQSKFFKNDFKNTVFVENANKKENKSFFLNIEEISFAIKNKKSISFNYTKYDINKQLINKREEPYIFSPYYLVCHLEKTYLIGKSKNHDDFTHFRIDKIQNVKISDEPYIELKKKEDPYEYAKNMIYMYKGKEETILIKFDKCILDDVIDTFGKDIQIKEGDDRLLAHVKSTRQGLIYFALQYLNHLEVLEPIDLRKDIINQLEEGLKKY